MLRGGAVVCMLQPQSFLGGRDTGAIRSALDERADLRRLWVTDEQLFDAGVQVCAPVLVRRSEPGRPRRTRRRVVAVQWRDSRAVEMEVDDPADSTEHPNWSPLLAAALGVPALRVEPLGSHRALGELARCTAGFRDEFYALAEVAEELVSSESRTGDELRLVTSGMIDPGKLRWGEGPRRIGGRTFVAPSASMSDLEARSPRVAGWVRARSVPKVLVASQTRVIEVAADLRGDCVGVTPVVSVEPLMQSEASVELLAASLAAPSARRDPRHPRSGNRPEHHIAADPCGDPRDAAGTGRAIRDRGCHRSVA